ncbi:MAG: hypothetical protein MK102_09520 [Fuerstiella sp.]|nr:hypothetical protein [Fuerstiella sp.]
MTLCVSFLMQAVLLFPQLDLFLPQLKVQRSPGEVPVPGAVRLPCGMLFEGMVSITNSLDPARGKDVSELRHIDQGFRHYDVSARIGARPVEDPAVIPSLEFSIQRRPGRARMPEVIGVPRFSAFDRNGEAVVKLQFDRNRTQEAQIGVSRINRNMVEITSLTHKWTFGMALSAIPDDVLYPGLLEKAVGFQDGGVRLTMSGMLMDAGRVEAAAALLNNVESEFPDLLPQVQAVRSNLRQQTASRILEELERRMVAGQPAEAAQYARRFPVTDLTPQVRVDVRNLITRHESLQRRVNSATAALQQTIGQFDDKHQRQQAREMVSAMLNNLDVHNIDRLTTWELLGNDPSTPAESRLAMAISGWMLGADEVTTEFSECHGLFQIRQSIADYVLLDESNESGRGSLARTMQKLEGFSVERVAALIRQLSPPNAVPLQTVEDGNRRFDLAESVAGIRCSGIVPSGYSTTRRYPLLIAIPRQGVSQQNTIDWWAHQADRFGFIVAVPEMLPQNSEDYTADAIQHRRVLQLIRHLKLGLQIDDNRVFIGGHGVGGAIAMDMASSHAEIFAGVISVAGLGRRHLQWSAHNSSDLGWYIVLGERQAFWYDRIGKLLKRLFRRVDSTRGYCNVLLARYPNRGFESYHEEAPSIFEWMSTTYRNPWPEFVECRMMRSTDLSWYWVRLDSIPERFQTLELPTTVTDPVSRYVTLEAKLQKNNSIRITAPGRGVVLLSPDMPNFDTDSKISIQARGPDKRVEFQPSVRDMLDEYTRTGERIRLCHMRVPFGQ